MATKSKFKAAEQQPVRARKVAAPVAQETQMAQKIAGTEVVKDAPQEPMLRVHVPKAFRLTDDQHTVHPYAAGDQRMPKSHAEHFYAQANGVTLDKDQED